MDGGNCTVAAPMVRPWLKHTALRAGEPPLAEYAPWTFDPGYENPVKAVGTGLPNGRTVIDVQLAPGAALLEEVVTGTLTEELALIEELVVIDGLVLVEELLDTGGEETEVCILELVPTAVDKVLVGRTA